MDNLRGRIAPPIRLWNVRDGVNHLYGAKFLDDHFEAWGQKFEYSMYQIAFPTHLEGRWTGDPGEHPTPVIRFYKAQAPPE